MDYDTRARQLAQPTPAQVRAARLAAGLTQAAAAALVHRADSARWREWERPAPTGRVIDLAVWELYLIKTGARQIQPGQASTRTATSSRSAPAIDTNTPRTK